MGIVHLWNDTDRGKPKYWDKNLSQYLSAHHKSHADCSGIEHRAVASGRCLAA